MEFPSFDTVDAYVPPPPTAASITPRGPRPPTAGRTSNSPRSPSAIQRTALASSRPSTASPRRTLTAEEEEERRKAQERLGMGGAGSRDLELPGLELMRDTGDPEGRATVNVHVVYSDSKKDVVRAAIQLFTAIGKQVESRNSDPSGKARIQIRPGKYLLVVEKDKHTSHRSEIVLERLTHTNIVAELVPEVKRNAIEFELFWDVQDRGGLEFEMKTPWNETVSAKANALQGRSGKRRSGRLGAGVASFGNRRPRGERGGVENISVTRPGKGLFALSASGQGSMQDMLDSSASIAVTLTDGKVLTLSIANGDGYVTERGKECVWNIGNFDGQALTLTPAKSTATLHLELVNANTGQTVTGADVVVLPGKDMPPGMLPPGVDKMAVGQTDIKGTATLRCAASSVDVTLRCTKTGYQASESVMKLGDGQVVEMRIEMRDEVQPNQISFVLTRKLAEGEAREEKHVDLFCEVPWGKVVSGMTRRSKEPRGMGLVKFLSNEGSDQPRHIVKIESPSDGRFVLYAKRFEGKIEESRSTLTVQKGNGDASTSFGSQEGDGFVRQTDGMWFICYYTFSEGRHQVEAIVPSTIVWTCRDQHTHQAIEGVKIEAFPGLDPTQRKAGTIPMAVARTEMPSASGEEAMQSEGACATMLCLPGSASFVFELEGYYEGTSSLRLEGMQHKDLVLRPTMRTTDAYCYLWLASPATRRVRLCLLNPQNESRGGTVIGTSEKGPSSLRIDSDGLKNKGGKFHLYAQIQQNAVGQDEADGGIAALHPRLSVWDYAGREVVYSLAGGDGHIRDSQWVIGSIGGEMGESVVPVGSSTRVYCRAEHAYQNVPIPGAQAVVTVVHTGEEVASGFTDTNGAFSALVAPSVPVTVNFTLAGFTPQAMGVQCAQGQVETIQADPVLLQPSTMQKNECVMVLRSSAKRDDFVLCVHKQSWSGEAVHLGHANAEEQTGGGSPIVHLLELSRNEGVTAIQLRDTAALGRCYAYVIYKGSEVSLSGLTATLTMFDDAGYKRVFEMGRDGVVVKGKYWVVVSVEQGEAEVVKLKSLTVKAEDPVTGKGIAGAAVSVASMLWGIEEPDTATTDDNGQCVLNNLVGCVRTKVDKALRESVEDSVDLQERADLDVSHVAKVEYKKETMRFAAVDPLSNAPLADAEIRITHSDYPADDYPSRTIVRHTDADGICEATCYVGTLAVMVKKDGFLPSSQTRELVPGTPHQEEQVVEVRLDCEMEEFEVTAMDSRSGFRVADAEVEVKMLRYPDHKWIKKTDSDGVCRIDVPKGPATVTIRKPGRVQFQAAMHVSAEQPRAKAPLKAEMPLAKQTVTGTAIDPINQKPLAGALVAIAHSEYPDAVSEVKTDANGKWEVEWFPGRSTVNVTKAGFESLSLTTDVLPGSTEETTVAFLNCLREKVLVTVVDDVTNKVIPKACVEVWADQYPDRRVTVETDDKGVATTECYIGNISVRVNKDSFEDTNQHCELKHGNKVEQKASLMFVQEQLQVSAVDSLNSKPVPGATVEFVSDRYPDHPFLVETGPDGKGLVGCPGGPGRLKITKPGRVAYSKERVNITPGQSGNKHEAPIKPSEQTVLGIATDPLSKKPLVDAAVEIAQSDYPGHVLRTRTDKNGRFEAQCYPGNCTMTVSKEGFKPLEVTQEVQHDKVAPETRAELQCLDEKVVVKAVDPITKRGLPDADVEVWADQYPHKRKKTKTDKNGEVSTTCYVGKVIVKINKDGFNETLVHQQLTPGRPVETKTDVHFVQESFEIFAVDHINGKPVTGAKVVFVSDQYPNHPFPAETGPDGKVVVGCPGGPGHIKITKPGRVAYSKERVDVKAGEPTSLKADVKCAKDTLKITAFDPINKERLSGSRVVVTPIEYPELSFPVETDKNGVATVKDMFVGKVSVSVQTEGRDHFDQTFEWGEATKIIEAPVKWPEEEVEVLVADAQGRPIEGALVTIQPAKYAEEQYKDQAWRKEVTGKDGMVRRRSFVGLQKVHIFERTFEERVVECDLKKGEPLLASKKKAIKQELPRRVISGVDVCFVMDCTGSMQNLIDACKETVMKISRHIIKELKAQKFSNAVVRMAFVGYRDFASPEEGSERISPNDTDCELLVLDFTDSIEKLEKFVDRVRADGGADWAEDVAGGLRGAMALKWEQDAKYVFLIADAPCHGEKYHQMDGNDSFPSGDPKKDEVYDQVATLMDHKKYQPQGVHMIFVKVGSIERRIEWLNNMERVINAHCRQAKVVGREMVSIGIRGDSSSSSNAFETLVNKILMDDINKSNQDRNRR